MKITIYELLGLIKDGKAPLRIKHNGSILTFDKDMNNYLYNDYDEIWTNCFIVNFKLNDEIEIIEEVEDKEYEDIDIINGDYVVPNTPATENEAYIMACFLAHEQIINALIRNQKKIIERLDK